MYRSVVSQNIVTYFLIYSIYFALVDTTVRSKENKIILCTPDVAIVVQNILSILKQVIQNAQKGTTIHFKRLPELHNVSLPIFIEKSGNLHQFMKQVQYNTYKKSFTNKYWENFYTYISHN